MKLFAGLLSFGMLLWPATVALAEEAIPPAASTVLDVAKTFGLPTALLVIFVYLRERDRARTELQRLQAQTEFQKVLDARDAEHKEAISKKDAEITRLGEARAEESKSLGREQVEAMKDGAAAMDRLTDALKDSRSRPR